MTHYHYFITWNMDGGYYQDNTPFADKDAAIESANMLKQSGESYVVEQVRAVGCRAEYHGEE